MCIYNANKATREAAAKEESLKVLAEGVKSPSEVKVLDTQQESPHAKENVAKELEKALKMAQKESRVVIGVPAAVKFLSAAPEDSLFCILAPPKMRDSATHIEEVLLKAFCLENDIYIIQVDSAEKMCHLLKANNLETCVLIQKSRSYESLEEILSAPEDSLIDFCEEYWDAPKQPIVQLPNT